MLHGVTQSNHLEQINVILDQGDFTKNNIIKNKQYDLTLITDCIKNKQKYKDLHDITLIT